MLFLQLIVHQLRHWVAANTSGSLELTSASGQIVILIVELQHIGFHIMKLMLPSRAASEHLREGYPRHILGGYYKNFMR